MKHVHFFIAAATAAVFASTVESEGFTAAMPWLCMSLYASCEGLRRR